MSDARTRTGVVGRVRRLRKRRKQVGAAAINHGNMGLYAHTLLNKIASRKKGPSFEMVPQDGLISLLSCPLV